MRTTNEQPRKTLRRELAVVAAEPIISSVATVAIVAALHLNVLWIIITVIIGCVELATKTAAILDHRAETPRLPAGEFTIPALEAGDTVVVVRDGEVVLASEAEAAPLTQSAGSPPRPPWEG